MIENYTIPVDFTNRDDDGSVRLITDETIQFIVDRGIQLVNGGVVRLSNGEVIATGVLEHRDGIWVATGLKWDPYSFK